MLQKRSADAIWERGLGRAGVPRPGKASKLYVVLNSLSSNLLYETLLMFLSASEEAPHLGVMLVLSFIKGYTFRVI